MRSKRGEMIHGSQKFGWQILPKLFCRVFLLFCQEVGSSNWTRGSVVLRCQWHASFDHFWRLAQRLRLCRSEWSGASSKKTWKWRNDVWIFPLKKINLFFVYESCLRQLFRLSRSIQNKWSCRRKKCRVEKRFFKIFKIFCEIATCDGETVICNHHGMAPISQDPCVMCMWT